MSTRFIPHRDMSADEIVKCAIQARAIIQLCEAAAWSIQSGSEREIKEAADSIQFALQLAGELIVPVQEALESHEGLKGGAA
ncbi:hypothetical protein C7441_12537 [Pseudaminobacter salicylatoxidans]|uniref:Uncharacterized protein n=1 Tax=Pseudaminobacter salicylatoxidans TaxID=93369 RepID=A0A316BL93_PSESE|nr:hypothetical protein [Pseudaminobacter salicylatoxidans]PWJ73853.1 hypothetical protein C7441_12537 [Pseudaminobacter salicylatoxidans]